MCACDASNSKKSVQKSETAIYMFRLCTTKINIGRAND